MHLLTQVKPMLMTLQAVMDWGAVLRQRYRKGSSPNQRFDVSNNYIGYYTDNG
jgi:hypothetical protein